MRIGPAGRLLMITSSVLNWKDKNATTEKTTLRVVFKAYGIYRALEKFDLSAMLSSTGDKNGMDSLLKRTIEKDRIAPLVFQNSNERASH